MTSPIEPKINSFCWAELASKNSTVAKKFYSGLLNWTFVEEEMPEGMGPYITAMVNNLPVAALFGMKGDAFKDVLPHWGSYIRVEDCDKVTTKATSLGATVIKPPFDIMEAGRMAVIQDPCGAFINLWEKKAHAGAPLQYGVLGTLCWNELLVHDPKAAFAFYSQLLDWTSETSDFGGQTYYSLRTADGNPIGGLMQIPHGVSCPPSWTVYFTVKSLEAAMDYITNNGGQVHFGPHDVHGMGRFASCQDAEGAQFSVFEYNI